MNDFAQIAQIRTYFRRYNSGNYNRDECLCRIGIITKILTQQDLQTLQGGKLTSNLRSKVLAWLRSNNNLV
ncbi:MAG: hypothetical protein CLLPBCKN_007210 [Chroococcidiopsis cubana SAG 39.79]|uniref:Uncharacterized protein n=1 Tax=Chroococcidiopsis cubana SAG 39.79 TaxID=388085 RepID=A0AB37URK9_9CYAN|nr:hypothetical protein [Chroococcidiopsis cubana SAG 39.79]RUT14056.1 hypothetical protein DSM107010_05390 [Chroococcidiopsis cubana SAG 39.79]